MTITIEAGKYYRARGGQKVGPIRDTGECGKHNFASPSEKFGRWASDGEDGFASCTVDESPGDLIAEWTDEPMTDTYKPGVWYGWNGGECPVHPKTVVEVLFDNGVRWTEKASQVQFNWTKFHGAFRIITPYVEPPKPLELWMNFYGPDDWAVYETRKEADNKSTPNRICCIRMVEAPDE